MEEVDKQKKAIIDMISQDIKLRSKKELIEKFINENMLQIKNSEDVTKEFNSYWQREQENRFSKICEDEKILPNKFQKLIDDYIFTEREPLRDDVINALDKKPSSILKRKSIGNRIINKITNFVETFVNGLG